MPNPTLPTVHSHRHEEDETLVSVQLVDSVPADQSPVDVFHAVAARLRFIERAYRLGVDEDDETMREACDAAITRLRGQVEAAIAIHEECERWPCLYGLESLGC